MGGQSGSETGLPSEVLSSVVEYSTIEIGSGGDCRRGGGGTTVESI